MSRDKTHYISADSEFVRSIGKHRIGDLIAMATVSINGIRREHGDEVAELLAEAGDEVTTKVNDTIHMLVDGTDVANRATIYLASVIAANTAVAIFSALDETRFERELEEYQNGGAE